MRLLYAGLPSGATCLAARGHRIVAALVADRDRTGVRRLRRTLGDCGAPVFVDPDLADEELVRLLATAKADALVSFFWPRRIPEEALRLADVALGVHPSLLPRHRGADPIFWTIRAGDETTGVTVHDLAAQMDRGDVRLQRARAVPEGATRGSLWRMLRLDAIVALGDVLGAGSLPAATSQADVGATEAPAPKDEDLEIRWSGPAEEILRLVRAASPDPGAFTDLGGRTLTVLAAAPTTHRIEPGDAVLLEEDLCVGTATTAVRLVRVESGGAVSRGREIAKLVPGVSEI